jgi:hypothetical protein
MLALTIIAMLAQAPEANPTPAMSPDTLREAMAYGARASEVKLYDLSAKMGRIQCAFSTPFLRVALAAYEAKRNYKTISPEAAEAAAAGPFVAVGCGSAAIGGSGPEAMRTFANVTNIVITTGKDGKGDATQPTSTIPAPELYQNAFGARTEASGLLAQFPVGAFRSGAELHVIFDRKIKYGFSSCSDCAIELKPEKRNAR